MSLNPKHSIKSAVFAVVRPVDSLRFQKDDSSMDEAPSYSYISDVQLLLNSERLVKVLGEDNYRNMLSGMVPKKSPYEGARFSDKQLFTGIKSRYVQTASETRAWIDSLTNAMLNLEDAAREQYKAKMEAELKRIAEEKSKENQNNNPPKSE